MCYQNGKVKRSDKNPAKSSLTESIINTMDSSKRKEVPLWRSISLNNEISERQNPLSNSDNVENKHSGSGRHILPAIVPELPERRKSRMKSLPETSSRSLKDNEVKNDKSSKFMEENVEITAQTPQTAETISKKPFVWRKSTEELQENNRSSTERQVIAEAHTQNVNSTSTVRRRSTFSESDVPNCVPINLSLKNKDVTSNQPVWSDVFGVHRTKRNEVNYNQHLTYTIPKQPSNVPKKPPHLTEENFPGNCLGENLTRALHENLEGGHVEKDGNCFFVTAIPSNALDPQKQSNVIVINFPHVQQQMSRMEKPNVMVPKAPEAQQSSLEMLDAAIMSLINIVKSSVESVFNIMSLPVLNRLYIDLSHYLLLPTVSIKMKMCIEDALNSLVSYILVNLFRAPRNSKARDFVHKILRLDLRPHMDFFISSLDIIQQKIKYEYFMDQLLKVLSRNPHEDFQVPLAKHVRRPFGDYSHVRPSLPSPQQFFPNHNQLPEFRDYPLSRPWMENLHYQHGNMVVPSSDPVGGIPQGQSQKRGRRQHQEADKNLLASMRMLENFNEPNLAMMRPDLYLADNR